MSKLNPAKTCITCGVKFHVWLKARGTDGQLRPSRANNVHRYDPAGRFHSLDCAARYGVMAADVKLIKHHDPC